MSKWGGVLGSKKHLLMQVFLRLVFRVQRISSGRVHSQKFASPFVIGSQ